MSTVSPQITDAVTQTNVKVVAESPAMAMSTILFRSEINERGRA